MPLNCPQTVSKLKTYKRQHQDLKQQFSDFMSQAPFLPDVKWDEPFMSSPYYKDITNAPKEIFDNLYDAKEKARVKLEELKELSGYIDVKAFVVKDALNPYSEGLKDGGITDPELIAEIKDIKINLQELLTQDKDAYKQAKLTEWVNDLPDNIKDFKLTKEQLENLKSRIEQGEIPIFMPGRLAQLNGLSDAINQLKPEWIKDGQKHLVKAVQRWDYMDQLIPIMIQIAEKVVGDKIITTQEIEKIDTDISKIFAFGIEGYKELVKLIVSIPEHPYIFTTKPSQKNERCATNNEASTQREELKKIQKNNPNINIGSISIGEYLAMQNRFTNRLKKKATILLKKLYPLDPLSPCYTRIIDIPIPRGGWYT